MVRFNRDPSNPTRSLFYVSNQGKEKEVLKTDGSILQAQFDPAKQNLYGLISRRIPGDTYAEQPYLSAINLETSQVVDLLKLPIQQDIHMSLSPDGLGILFDQVVSSSNNTADGVIRGRDGKAIASSQLWFLPLAVDKKGMPLVVEPERLEIAGLKPQWLP
jgi:hypothetical protein